MSRTNLRLILCAALALTSFHSTQADVIKDWNTVTFNTFLQDTDFQNPGMASRNMAMVNLAMYDAVNGISPTHQQFYTHSAAPTGASVDAAAIQAAYRVLAANYPSQATYLDNERSAALSVIPDSPAKTNGINYGDAVGMNIVTIRANDGYDNMSNYVPNGGAGHWEPDPLNPSQEAWGPAWGTLQPFAIPSSASMLPPAMPDISSAAYAAAFDEVKRLGSKNSTERTPDQTEAGIFWAYDRLGMGTPMRMYGKIMQTIGDNEGNTLHDNARMFAMASTSMADAGIVAWDSKFVYDYWRPISGIRRADEDNNPDTIADPTWEPLGAPGGISPIDGSVINDFTPPFPTYVSGHASFGGAMFTALENFFETDDLTFDVESDELPGVVRTFDSLSAASEENGRSRVYLGIHWNFDDTEARILGGEVADYMADNHFGVVPEPSGILLLAFGIGSLLLRRIR